MSNYSSENVEFRFLMRNSCFLICQDVLQWIQEAVFSARDLQLDSWHADWGQSRQVAHHEVLRRLEEGQHCRRLQEQSQWVPTALYTLTWKRWRLWNRLTQVRRLCRHVLDQPSVQDHAAGGGWRPGGWWGGVQFFSSPHAEGPPQISAPWSGHAHYWLCSLWGE